MSAYQPILEALLPPLRYAARDGFAHVGTLKAFDQFVAQVGQKATRAGLPAERATRFANLVKGFDAMSAPARTAALKSLIGELKPFVTLPPELEPLASLTKPDVLASPAPAPKTVEPKLARAQPATTKRAPKAQKLFDEDKAQADAPYAIAPPKVPTQQSLRGPLATPLEPTFRIHPRLAALLKKKGLTRAGDILFLMPRGYEDRRQLATLSQLVPGERGSAIAEVRRLDESFKGRGRRTLKVIFADATGSIAGTFFNYAPWMKSRFAVGKKFIISGELRATTYGREMAHPEAEPLDEGGQGAGANVHFERIVPLYPGFERGEQRGIRDLAHRVVARFSTTIEDPLPETLRTKLGLPALGDALRQIHFPADDVPLDELQRWATAGHRRLAFDELFFLQLGLSLRRQDVKVEPGIAFDTSPKRLQGVLDRLPWPLTNAQRRALDEICRDMSKPEPMNRLLQGDVGSGKTAVALCASMLAIEAGYQAAVMAPTEILAEQHARNMQQQLLKAGVEVGLLTGSQSAKEKREARARLAMGRMQLAVGTHALLEENIQFAKLGVVVIDEQHRFGVMQRAVLRDKGAMPDVLVMTATPIPRTLAMAAYGDLDLSIIDELPPGRTPINTRVFGEKSRDHAWELVGRELDEGRQAYVVYPLVEESEKSDLQSATEGAELVQAAFPKYRVGLLHGRMKAEQKDAVMRAFRDKELHILVSTTVIEVGVDVPNATMMVIESAERFGLSQLHQLRGRVGRGKHASQCLLIAGYARSEVSKERLAVMAATNDGFVIAQKDLELRGPGELLGTRQSGLPELAVANLARDQDLLAIARREALALVENDTRLSKPAHAPLRRALEERWEGKLALAKIG